MRILSIIILFMLFGNYLHIAYLYSLKVDVFPWGNEDRDGLYLLFLQIENLPILIILIILKYFVSRKSKYYYIKYSYILYMLFGLIVCLFNNSMIFGMLISVLLSIVISIELFLQANEKQNS